MPQALVYNVRGVLHMQVYQRVKTRSIYLKITCCLVFFLLFAVVYEELN